MQDFLNAAISANQEIAAHISAMNFEELCQTTSLGYGGDMSRQIDIMAENIFIKKLSSFGNIYSEECGFLDNNSAYDIFIDPIDGSNNFVSNFPYYGTSVALKYQSKHLAAVIVNLANGDLFIKDQKRFQKANLHNLVFHDIQCNLHATMGIFEKSYSLKTLYQTLEKNHIKYRSPGAIALSLAYAHQVNFVLFGGVARPYDIEAGMYMCNDLYMIKQDALLFISKDKETFDRMSGLFKEGS
ncbi:inositol monophosphatase family protein [Sulfurospirillum sp. 1612]|uniref:inositol monophosphatase family protein n=1 Tax=Sulfurospirillum sp. 1612 TaxID=3094835 RepID=UPI002F94C61F